MKNKIDAILDGLIPSVTEILEPGAALMNKSNPQMSQNPQAFGFAFEHLQAIGYNINAGLKGSESRADQLPRDGMTKLSPDLYIQKVGQVIAEIQAQASSAQYLEKQVKSQRYWGEILSNSENANLVGATLLIDIDGVQSFPISQNFAQWVAENPYLAANVMSVAATVGEVNGAGLEGAAINATLNILFQSIKKIGAYCRGEKELDQAELFNILEVTLAGLKTGFIRGVAIKVIQKLMDGSAFAALGFTVWIEVIPTLIKVLKDEITLEQAITEVGPRMLTSAVTTTVVILFPTVGKALLSPSVIKAIWEEISPEWKRYLVKTRTDIGSAIATGNAVIAISGVGIIEQQVWNNLTQEQRQAVIEKMKHSTPDQVKIAYNMTLEKATEGFDVASGWLGERTSELAQSVESATPMHTKKAINKILSNHQKTSDFVYKAARKAKPKTTQLTSLSFAQVSNF
ncbi:MAG: hypothetical protein ACOVQ7_03990 [Limnoraphis robusta]|jgi:hypothetical protein